MKKISFSLIAAALILSACMGKNYKKPVTDLPEVSVTSKEEQNINKDILSFEKEKWWNIFQDIVLDKMEDEALKYNYDLKQAMARVAESKAKLAVARSNYYPTFDLVGKVSDSKSYMNFKDYGIYMDRFTAGVSVSYELDLWGKYWRNSESAKADFLSAQAEKDSVKLLLTAQVAQVYFELRALDSQLEIAKNTLQSREESFRVYSSRFKKGIINELDLRRVEAEMESVRAQVYEVEYQLKLTETSLSILTGRSPRAIIENNLERGNKIEDTIVIPEIPSEVPSDLLSRRPDIKAMEYTLKSANAQVGSAKAALFPVISLTGFGGFASHELEDLFKDGNDTWSYSGDIAVPIFYGGKKMKNYKAVKAVYEQMLQSYQKTIQTAFKETLDAINTNKLSKKTMQSCEKQTVALEKSFKLAVKRERAGLADLLDVLDVQRMLLQAQMNLVTSQKSQLVSIVDICKTLGGGWTEENGFVSDKK